MRIYRHSLASVRWSVVHDVHTNSILLLSFTDCAEFNASLSTTNSFGAPDARSEYSHNTKGARRAGSQDLRIPGNGIHRRDCIPESIDNQTENRLESIRKRIQRLVEADGFR